uniref:Uncharacterized protein n=1 Tax=Phenylobacterium glaciei TaxID=2803784 RepID=A0A974S9P9_9CAUL|nr:hypothetical protein JKL49_24000 [Phenylobacterium glaciei]
MQGLAPADVRTVVAVATGCRPAPACMAPASLMALASAMCLPLTSISLAWPSAPWFRRSGS